MRITVFVLIAALTLVIGGAALAQNLLLNPKMESWTGTSTADNWTFFRKGTASNDNLSKAFAGTTSTLAVPSPKYVSAVQSQGVDVIYKSVKASHAGVYQQVATTAGQRYSISTWIACTNYGFTPNPTTNLAYEGWLDVENGALTVPTYTLFTNASNANWSAGGVSDGSWVQASLDFIATGTTITVFLDGYKVDGATNSTKNVRVFFDDASVTAIPEPGSIIALLSGLVGLVGFGVRRRK